MPGLNRTWYKISQNSKKMPLGSLTIHYIFYCCVPEPKFGILASYIFGPNRSRIWKDTVYLNNVQLIINYWLLSLSL